MNNLGFSKIFFGKKMVMVCKIEVFVRYFFGKSRLGPSAKFPTGQKGQQLPKLTGPNRIQLARTILKE